MFIIRILSGVLPARLSTSLVQNIFHSLRQSGVRKFPESLLDSKWGRNIGFLSSLSDKPPSKCLATQGLRKGVPRCQGSLCEIGSRVKTEFVVVNTGTWRENVNGSTCASIFIMWCNLSRTLLTSMWFCCVLPREFQTSFIQIHYCDLHIGDSAERWNCFPYSNIIKFYF